MTYKQPLVLSSLLQVTLHGVRNSRQAQLGRFTQGCLNKVSSQKKENSQGIIPAIIQATLETMQIADQAMS